MNDKPATWRCSKKVRNLAVLSLPFYAVVGLGSVWAAWANYDQSFPNPDLAAVLFGVVWTFFVLLAGYLFLFWHRHRLLVDERSIRQIGVFSDQTICLHTLNELKWKCYPAGGSAQLSDLNHTLKIEFGNYSRDDRKRLIDKLRAIIASGEQTGWDRFSKRFEPTPEKLTATKRARRLLIALFGFHTVVFLTMGVTDLGVKFVFAAGLNLLIAVYIVQSEKRNIPPTPHETEEFCQM